MVDSNGFNIDAYRNQAIKVRIRSKGSFRNKLFAACRTLLVAAPQGCDDTIGAESMQAFLCGHGFLQHIEAYWAPKATGNYLFVLLLASVLIFLYLHQLRVQTTRRYGYFGVICNHFLRCSMQLVKRKIPSLILRLWLH